LFGQPKVDNERITTNSTAFGASVQLVIEIVCSDSQLLYFYQNNNNKQDDESIGWTRENGGQRNVSQGTKHNVEF